MKKLILLKHLLVLIMCMGLLSCAEQNIHNSSKHYKEHHDALTLKRMTKYLTNAMPLQQIETILGPVQEYPSKNKKYIHYLGQNKYPAFGVYTILTIELDDYDRLAAFSLDSVDE